MCYGSIHSIYIYISIAESKTPIRQRLLYITIALRTNGLGAGDWQLVVSSRMSLLWYSLSRHIQLVRYFE